MNVLRQGAGRNNQKKRTRAALVDAARGLLRQQVPPTVEEVAEAAGISRATAYRYFPTQESLLLEIATISPLFDPVEEAIGNITGREAPERLGILLERMNETIFSNEAQMRSALGAYMRQWIDARRRGDSTSPVLRVGRRMLYLDKVLADVGTRLSAFRWRRLRAALALTMGPEALVVMKDVCRVSEREALEILRWAGLALLHAGLNEANRLKRARRSPPSRPTKSRSRPQRT